MRWLLLPSPAFIIQKLIILTSCYLVVRYIFPLVDAPLDFDTQIFVSVREAVRYSHAIVIAGMYTSI